MEQTLLLNASYEPLKVVHWQKAITLLCQGKVEVISVYDREIRAVSITFKLPSVIRLEGRLQLRFDVATSHVRDVIRNFFPGVASRGVNQLSSYVDAILASFLPTGAVASLAEARRIIGRSFPVERFEPSAAELWNTQYKRFQNYLEHSPDAA